MPSMRSCYVWLPRLLLLALAVCGMGYISSRWDESAHKVCSRVCADATPHFPYPVEGQYRVANCNNLSTETTFVYPSNGDKTGGQLACPAHSSFSLNMRWGVLTYLYNSNQLGAASPELHGKLQASEAELRFPMTIEDCQCGVLEAKKSFWTKWVFVFSGVCFLLLLLVLYLLFWAVKRLSLWVIRHTLLPSADVIRVQDACNGHVTVDKRFLQPMRGYNTDIEFCWNFNTSKTPKLDQLICQPMHANLRYFFKDAENGYIKVLNPIRDKLTRDKVKAAITELGLVADRWVMVQTIHFVSLFIFTCGFFALGIYKLV